MEPTTLLEARGDDLDDAVAEGESWLRDHPDDVDVRRALEQAVTLASLRRVQREEEEVQAEFERRKQEQQAKRDSQKAKQAKKAEKLKLSEDQQSKKILRVERGTDGRISRVFREDGAFNIERDESGRVTRLVSGGD